MNYYLIFAVVVILVVVTFLLLVFVPKPDYYYDPFKICKELLILSKEENLEKIIANIKKYDLAETEEKYTDFIIYKNEAVMDSETYPDLYDLCLSIPNVEYISLIKYHPKTNLSIHSPEEKVTISCVLPLSIPGTGKAIIAIDGEKKICEIGKWILLDSNVEHTVYNNSESLPLMVLLVKIRKLPNK